MHLLDEEELAHVGKVLRKGYVRVHRPKKKTRVKNILFCVLFSLLALLFLGLSLYCIYWMVHGFYLIVTLPGFIVSAALLGISIREILFSLDNYGPTFALFKRPYVPPKSPPNFLPEPDVEADSTFNQSSTIGSPSQSLQSFGSEEEAVSVFRSTSGDEVVKYSAFDESVQFVKAAKMIRSVSQYEVDSVPNQDQLIAETAAQPSSSSSRKRFCHNFESEEDLMEMKTLPFVESSVPVVSKEAAKVSEKGSSQSLPAMKFTSNSDT